MSKIIDLKAKLEKKPSKPTPKSEPEFEIHHIDKPQISNFKQERPVLVQPTITTETEIPTPQTPVEPIPTKLTPTQEIEVSFKIFSELISHPNSKKVIEENSDDTITLNANLLAQLASANEPNINDYKAKIIFCIGLTIGVAFTWILLTQ